MDKSILVIDADKESRNGVANLLRNSGYYTVVAASRHSAESCLERYSPDLIISDLKLNDSSGFDILKFIRSKVDTTTIPFVFLSKEYDELDRLMRLKPQADGYLQKPYRAIDLLDLVYCLLERNGNRELKYG